ncbi:INDH1 [Populus alba x Populus x berolinensis]|uniref:INDH1 n=1 Tax=Populus alba x Populus x berolinensis TaxID=444605 RepID=A0AAD6RC98_9ROSI|nr:INDH1 [Populus alba x Populus x berolinensis]
MHVKHASIRWWMDMFLLHACAVPKLKSSASATCHGGIWDLYSIILGFVENMSFFKCPHCGEPSFIFGKEGTRNAAASMGYKLIGEIPLEVDIRKGSDEGVPVVISAPDSVISKAYGDTAQNVVSKLEELAKEQSLHPEINL